MKKFLISLLAVLLIPGVVCAANALGVTGTGSKGLKIAAPGIQLTNDTADPTDGKLASGRLSVKSNVLRFYNGTAWANVATGTSSSADAVYNAAAWDVVVDTGGINFSMQNLARTVKIYSNITGTHATLFEVDAFYSDSVVTDGLKLITTGATATMTDGVDASDPGLTNALNIGANVITGTTGTIALTDFTVGADGNTAILTDTAGSTAMLALTHSATSGTQADGLKVSIGTGGTMTDGVDVSDTDITNAINIGGNAITGTNFSVTAAGVITAAGWSVNAITAAATNGDLSLDGNGSGGVVLNATGTGGITLTTNVTCSGDLDIDGNDLTSAGDLVITPAGGDVDFSVADIQIDSGKKISFDGTTESNYIYLSTNLAAIASADILLDPAGGDIDCDAADLQLDAGKKLSLNGATETDAVYSSTDLQIVAAADIVLTPTGTQVDVSGADLTVDGGKKVGLNAVAGLANDFLYLSTNVILDATADIVLDPGGGPGGGQVDVDAADLCVDAGEEIGLNGVAGVGSDRLYLSTDVILDATADIVLDPGGGQVDVNAGDLAVDSTKKVGFNGIAALTNDFINHDGTDLIIDAAADIKLNGAVSVDVGAAFTVATTSTFTGSVTVNGAQIIGDGATEIVGCKRDVVTDIDNETVTIAQSGTVFDNTGDGDGTIFTLPEASTAIGCWYTFVVVAAQPLNINPGAANDRFIAPITDAIGDSIQSSTAGDSVTIMCIGADSWVILSAYPAATDWPDAN